MEMCALSNRVEKPTIAYCFGCVRSVLRSCFRFFGCDDIVFPKMATVGIGIVVPVDGFCVMFAPEFTQQIREETLKVFSRPNFRRCCDLARPMGLQAVSDSDSLTGGAALPCAVCTTLNTCPRYIFRSFFIIS